MKWNWVLGEACHQDRLHPTHWCYRLFFLNCIATLSKILWYCKEHFALSTSASHSKCAWPHCQQVANKGLIQTMMRSSRKHIPDRKVLGANMGLIWDRQDPGGPHVGPVNFTIWDIFLHKQFCRMSDFVICSGFIVSTTFGTHRKLN